MQVLHTATCSLLQSCEQIHTHHLKPQSHLYAPPLLLFFFLIPSSVRTHTPVDSISSSQLRLQVRLGPTRLQLTEIGGGRPYLGPRPLPRPRALAPGAGGGRCHSSTQYVACLWPQSVTFERFGDGAFLKTGQGVVHVRSQGNVVICAGRLSRWGHGLL